MVTRARGGCCYAFPCSWRSLLHPNSLHGQLPPPRDRPPRRKDRLNFVVVDGEPLFFRQRDGPYFPLLRVLHKCAWVQIFVVKCCQSTFGAGL